MFQKYEKPYLKTTTNRKRKNTQNETKTASGVRVMGIYLQGVGLKQRIWLKSMGRGVLQGPARVFPF